MNLNIVLAIRVDGMWFLRFADGTECYHTVQGSILSPIWDDGYRVIVQ